MDVTGSVYGGGVFCALIMMGLNVSLLTLTCLHQTDTSKVHDHCKYEHSWLETNVEHGS